MNFVYTVSASTNEPIMLINGLIGAEVNAAQFENELRQLDTMGKSNIHIYINSPGGDMADGLKIHKAIMLTKTPVYTFNSGVAANVAATIFGAGRRRIMADYAVLKNNDSYLNSKDALKMGLCTIIEKSSELNTPEYLNVAAAQKTGNKNIQKIIHAAFVGQATVLGTMEEIRKRNNQKA